MSPRACSTRLTWPVGSPGYLCHPKLDRQTHASWLAYDAVSHLQPATRVVLGVDGSSSNKGRLSPETGFLEALLSRPHESCAKALESRTGAVAALTTAAWWGAAGSNPVKPQAPKKLDTLIAMSTGGAADGCAQDEQLCA